MDGQTDQSIAFILVHSPLNLPLLSGNYGIHHFTCQSILLERNFSFLPEFFYIIPCGEGRRKEDLSDICLHRILFWGK